jgi:thioredoxin-dependent peroxiredoxin
VHLSSRCIGRSLLVEEGALAPEFELASDDGHPVKLSDFRGHAAVLYFYPRDETPGCDALPQQAP